MKNLFEEPYIEVVRFPADAFTNTVQSLEAVTDADDGGPSEELGDQG